jgi:peptidoglycan/xylan/chitin deacetylase (PgdA/CDA1 family)
MTALALLVSFWVFGGQAAPPRQVNAPEPGDALAPFHLEHHGGEPFEWKPGRPALITFCAYWCDTWKTHLARVAETETELKGLPIDYLAISVDGRWTELSRHAQFVNEIETLKDPGGAWSSGLGIDKVPYTLVVDGEGVIRWASQGIQRSADMAARVRDALTPVQKGGRVFLTFDDFPKPDSERLLDSLRTLGVHATFFCVCARAEESKDLLQRAVREGNALEVHAWLHDEKEIDLGECDAAIYRSAGVHPGLVRRAGKESIERFDGGRIDAAAVDPYDYLRPGVKELLRRVLSNLRPGCEIQLHAGVSDTLLALPDLVAGIRRQGFQIGLLQ